LDLLAKKQLKSSEDVWENEESKELLLQREALRAQKQLEAASHSKERKVEGKQPNETMKEFKQRVRAETKKVSLESVVSMAFSSCRF
jgi:hypothetical protein